MRSIQLDQCEPLFYTINRTAVLAMVDKIKIKMEDMIMLKKIKTMLSLLLVAMMVIVTVPSLVFAEENTQEIIFNAGENEGEIIEELDMSNFTIVILDKNGNVVPMIMPMSTTTAQTWPDMTLGAGNSMYFYNNKNNGYINIEPAAQYALRGVSNKNFYYKIGINVRYLNQGFSWSTNEKFFRTTDKDFVNTIAKGDICLAIKNTSSYAVKLSNLKFVIIR